MGPGRTHPVEDALEILVVVLELVFGLGHFLLDFLLYLLGCLRLFCSLERGLGRVLAFLFRHHVNLNTIRPPEMSPRSRRSDSVFTGRTLVLVAAEHS